jgi:hypothetical protein
VSRGCDRAIGECDVAMGCPEAPHCAPCMCDSAERSTAVTAGLAIGPGDSGAVRGSSRSGSNEIDPVSDEAVGARLRLSPLHASAVQPEHGARRRTMPGWSRPSCLPSRERVSVAGLARWPLRSARPEEEAAHGSVALVTTSASLGDRPVLLATGRGRGCPRFSHLSLPAAPRRLPRPSRCVPPSRAAAAPPRRRARRSSPGTGSSR